jgi:hypothetical protein
MLASGDRNPKPRGARIHPAALALYSVIGCGCSWPSTKGPEVDPGDGLPNVVANAVFEQACDTPSTPLGLPEPGALRGEVFFLPPGTSHLPDLSLLEPEAATLCSNELNVPPRKFSLGFPGLRGRCEWFAIRYEGHFRVSTPGPHNFLLRSDDGSRVYIDGDLAIDNDGLHGSITKTQSVTLTPGTHALRVDYLQGPRADLALQLFVLPPGAKTKRLLQGDVRDCTCNCDRSDAAR